MQIGDRVKFVNESLSGTITRIIDAKTLGVSIEDGFEIPVLRSEVMLAERPNAVEQHDKKDPEIRRIPGGEVAEIFLLFEQSSQNWYKASLVNNSRSDILLSVMNRQGGQFKPLFAGRVEKGLSYLFNTLNLEEQDQWGKYCFRIIFHESSCEIPRAPWYLEYQFRSKDFIKPLEGREVTSYIIPLKPDRVEQFALTTAPSEKKESPAAGQIKIERPSEVVDLHIQHLVNHIEKLSADEALRIQMESFINHFEKALALDYEKITFIHGVGNGTLKQRIWKHLSGHPSVDTFYEARKEKFGYGATEVVFK